MNYYKILKDGIIIDTNNVFLRWQEKHKIMIGCEAGDAQFIQSSDQSTIWRTDWLNAVPDDLTPLYELADAVEISEEEYTSLRAILDSGQQPEDTEPEPKSDNNDPVDDGSLEYLKQVKISALSAACNAVITNGIDVALSDGLIHHFSLSTEDQLNLVSLSALILQGQSEIPYHADDEACTFFSADDFQAVVTAATDWKTYHESYFNSLKAYVLSMETVEELASVEYGMEIPTEYQSIVYQQLVAAIEGGTE